MFTGSGLSYQGMAPRFGEMMSGFQGMPNQTPFSSALAQQMENRAGLMSNALTGAVTLRGAEIDGQARRDVANIQADALKKTSGNSSSDRRRAGLLGLLSLGGGMAQGSGFRPAGAALGLDPSSMNPGLTSLAGLQGNLNTVFDGFNTTRALTTDAWSQGTANTGQQLLARVPGQPR
jgi:hypothetical protein